MSRHTNKYWLQKVKLWCILHGLHMSKAIVANCKEGVCPNWRPVQYVNDFGCCLEWPERLSVNADLTKVGKEPKDCHKFEFCIEWVKHV